MDLLGWLPSAIGGAAAFMLWHKLDRLGDKVDKLFETELREIHARLAVVETHLGIKGPAK